MNAKDDKTMFKKIITFANIVNTRNKENKQKTKQKDVYVILFSHTKDKCRGFQTDISIGHRH